MKKVLCPVCWHEETFRAIRQNGEPVRDDASTMLWHRPEGGARGQIVTMWDGGHLSAVVVHYLDGGTCSCPVNGGDR